MTQVEGNKWQPKSKNATLFIWAKLDKVGSSTIRGSLGHSSRRRRRGGEGYCVLDARGKQSRRVDEKCTRSPRRNHRIGAAATTWIVRRGARNVVAATATRIHVRGGTLTVVAAATPRRLRYGRRGLDRRPVRRL